MTMRITINNHNNNNTNNYKKKTNNAKKKKKKKTKKKKYNKNKNKNKNNEKKKRTSSNWLRRSPAASSWACPYTDTLKCTVWRSMSRWRHGWMPRMSKQSNWRRWQFLRQDTAGESDQFLPAVSNLEPRAISRHARGSDIDVWQKELHTVAKTFYWENPQHSEWTHVNIAHLKWVFPISQCAKAKLEHQRQTTKSCHTPKPLCPCRCAVPPSGCLPTFMSPMQIPTVDTRNHYTLHDVIISNSNSGTIFAQSFGAGAESSRVEKSTGNDHLVTQNNKVNNVSNSEVSMSMDPNCSEWKPWGLLARILKVRNT